MTCIVVRVWVTVMFASQMQRGNDREKRELWQRKDVKRVYLYENTEEKLFWGRNEWGWETKRMTTSSRKHIIVIRFLSSNFSCDPCFNAQLMCNAKVCTLCAYIIAIACHDMTLVISQIYDDRLLTLSLPLLRCVYLFSYTKTLLDLATYVILSHSPCFSNQIKISKIVCTRQV